MATPPRALVLVVDDEPLILDILAELLADEGYRVQCAPDGQRALDQINVEAPDLIISDVNMPRLGGVRLVRELRNRGDHVPVILISAIVTTVDLPRIRFVAKPFDLDELVLAVERDLEPGTR